MERVKQAVELLQNKKEIIRNIYQEKLAEWLLGDDAITETRQHYENMLADLLW